MTATVPRARPAAEQIDPKVLKTGLILVVGVLAVVFDTTIVSVALHTLAAELQVPVSTIQWVTTGYLLALGMSVPLSTWGLRRFGGKRLWMFSLAVFLVASVGASLAWNAGSLIAWRVVQGFGGGLMLPVMTTLIMQAAGGKALGKTVTIVALPALLGPILGPLLGGAILTQLSWRFMFWVNVPFCAVGLLLAAIYMPKDPAPVGKPALDIGGLALLAPGIAAVLLGLSNAGRSAGFDHADVLLPWIIGAALLVAFAGYAWRRDEPLADIRLFTRRPVASASAVLFFSGFALYGAMLLLPLYYQQARGVGALTAGILLIPQGIGSLLSRSVTGRLTDSLGARPIAASGFAVVALATVPFALAGAHTNAWLLAAFLVARGFGLGAITIPVMAAAYIGLDKAQVAHSSVLTRTAQQIGGSFGTAVLAVVLEQALAAHPGRPTSAFDIAFWWTIGATALAVLPALWLPGRADPAAELPSASGAPGRTGQSPAPRRAQ